MSRHIGSRYPGSQQLLSRCEWQTVIGFMSTRIINRCDKRPEPGRAYCKEHEVVVKAKMPHNVWDRP